MADDTDGFTSATKSEAERWPQAREAMVLAFRTSEANYRRLAVVSDGALRDDAKRVAEFLAANRVLLAARV